jgi:hypothetical protein
MRLKEETDFVFSFEIWCIGDVSFCNICPFCNTKQQALKL